MAVSENGILYKIFLTIFTLELVFLYFVFSSNEKTSFMDKIRFDETFK